MRSARLSSVKKRRPVPPSGGPASRVKIATGILTLVPVLGMAYCRQSASPANASAGIKVKARAADRARKKGRAPDKLSFPASRTSLIRHMFARDISESQRGSERDAGAGIVAAHDSRHVVVNCIEARDRLAVGIECAGVLVGPDAGIGAEIADHHLDRVERSVLDRRDARVRPMQRVALVAVVGARSLAESRIAAFRRRGVEFGNGGLESLSVDAGAIGEFGQGRAALEIAGGEMMAKRPQGLAGLG